jgi:hypothetical protein
VRAGAYAGFRGLEVAESLGRGWRLEVRVGGDGVHIGAKVGAAFEGATDDVARAETDGQREGEDDATEEDSEGELDDRAADLKVIEDHSGGQDEDEPLNAEREEASVLQLGVDGADEDGALEEAGDEGSDDEQNDRADGVGQVRKDEERYLSFAGEGRVKGRDADEAADGHAGPEDDPREQSRGAVGWGPVRDGAGGVAGEALVELCGCEGLAKECGQPGADGGEDDDGEQESDEAGKKFGQLDENLVSGLSEGEFDLLPHKRVSLRVLPVVVLLPLRC